MQFTKKIAVFTLILSILLTGCTNPPAAKSASELPDPATAGAEAKDSLRKWQNLLETGQNQAFVHASMPPEIYSVSITESGELKPEVLDRLRAYAPKIVNALNEAQFLEPYIEGENVVFEFDEIHSSNGFFKDEKIFLTKSSGRWYFNGEMISEVSK